MKKIMFGLAAAIAMVAAADIESANIVGYTQKDADARKFIILGAQFEQVAGGMSIEGLISGVSAVPCDDEGVFKQTAAQIQIPNGVGYTTRYYLSDGWYKKSPDEWDQKPGWCDEDGLIATDSLTPGVAIWLKDPNGNAKVVVAGAVPADDSTVVSCPATFALRANAYPKDLVLNTTDMVVSGISAVKLDDDGAFKLTAPQIQIPNGVGYTTRYYLSDGWYKKSPDEWDQKAGWCDEDGLIVSDVIPVAQGFWTKGVGSGFSATFNK